jgi:cytochrome c
MRATMASPSPNPPVSRLRLAPAITSAEAWAPRIDKGIETLQQHAIEGFTGSAGYMPPKGGRLDLSDPELRDAVEYMVSQAGGE